MGLLDTIIGAVLPGVGAAAGQQLQNQWSAAQAQKQMDFQERMSSTAWQRSVADMHAAGINPIFGAAGASTPMGAMASGSSPIEAGVSTAMQARRLQADLGVAASQAMANVARAGADDASRRSTLAGIPPKQFVGDVAGNARSLYQAAQDYIRGLLSPAPPSVSPIGPKVIRAQSSARQAAQSSAPPMMRLPSSEGMPIDSAGVFAIPYSKRRP